MFNGFKINKGEKFIMVENGKPTYVVMSYDDYENMLARRPSESSAHHGRPEVGLANDRVGRAEEEFSARLVMDTPNVPEDISKIRLEDLPL
ncbi:MAG: hypothetical protein A3G49_01540 [Candidatus Sungbacteria bacterium RIFCSPLOWO2_12_FULL_41_11]|uniref:Antitoxin n=1 Tax=Candidatus Sungbacteria bacterium RIFCSPLOWO2_12_FULL_41_11 TaxID=1802286 RepID=A0A1G2LQM0_9BACT|nr:MAG: hypothetical protein UV01_C0011G0027 [Parcubacteria group bacterium GW2011_GWA2_42_14]OGZ97314.1 MAG: hypothetical protein A3D41_04845 [Candidatus Sungbacteria bacterium RIFCSPHIGHO2_02_FULL_41_12b]OHA13906.1 MAG: hypothetical protein A3G49_01540 [Candidatus Sungbacteria bacterium RIFCSPLOWO2_12_FULL_41_11]